MAAISELLANGEEVTDAEEGEIPFSRNPRQPLTLP